MPANAASSAGDLHAAALDCLACADPARKVETTTAAAAAFASGRLAPGNSAPPIAVVVPGRPARPRLIAPRDLPQRGLGSDEGRAAFVHAIAHIEFNAVNLAWDAVYRFRGMPDAFYADWVGVAADEARHYSLLAARLQELGHAYGDFDAHDGLWEMALRTADDLLARMALVPRVLEARGLDVTPQMIARLRSVGDHRTADILELILREEVAHVAAGTRWFHWCCAQAGMDPEPTFASLLDAHAPHAVRAPLNAPARRAAGFSASEMDDLQRRAALRQPTPIR